MNTTNAPQTSRKRLQGLMLFRVLLVTLFMTGAIATNIKTFEQLSSPQNLSILTLIIGTYTLTIWYALWLRRATQLAKLAYTQIGFDILISSVLVLSTGSLHTSIFVFTLYLPIIGAAIVMHGQLSLACASIVSVFILYLTVGDAGMLPLPFGQKSANIDLSRLIFEAIINIVFAYLLAWISGQLTQQLGEAKEEIVRHQEDIRELQTLNEDILASLNSGLLTIDNSDKIIFFNRAAEQITHVQAEEVYGEKLEEIFPDIADALKETKADSGGETRFERPYTTPQGHRIYLGFSTSPLRAEDDGSKGMIIIFQDLTNFKKLESRAKRSERLAAIGQLSAAIAHEIRNPLASISGSVEMLQGISEQDEEQELLMGIMLREVDRLNHLISDFLEYSRPRPIQKTTTQVTTLLREVLTLFRNRSQNIAVRLHIDESLEEVQVRLDREAFRQIIWNLLNNAAEAMLSEAGTLPSISQVEQLPQNATTKNKVLELYEEDSFESPHKLYIELSRSSDGEKLILCVEDSGPGISAELKDRIFEPFFTTKKQGTGLGLATLFRLIEDHQGLIEIRTPKVLGGACFVVELPCDVTKNMPTENQGEDTHVSATA